MVRTFLLADVRGYTRYTAEHGDDAASTLARRLASLVGSTVPGFDGELLEIRGDETLCVFTSARQALRAAVQIQRRLRAPEKGDPFPLGVGMGLDAGEAIPTDGGYRGAALNMAGRLVSAAGPGEVLATERLVRLSGQVDGLHWTRPRSMRLKGLADPELVVRVEPDEPLPAPTILPSTPRPRRRLIGAVGVALVLVVVLAAALIEHGRSTSPTAVRTPRQSVAVIDIGQRRVVKDVHLNATPESMAAGGGEMWVGSADDNVTPINEKTYRAASPMGLCCNPDYLSFGDGALWAFDDGSAHLMEVDPRNGPVAQRRLWRCQQGQLTQLTGCSGGGVVAVGNEVWVGRGNGIFTDQHTGSLVQLRTSDLAQLGSIRHVVVGLLARDQTQVWSYGDNAVQADGLPIAPPRNIYRYDLPEDGKVSSSRGGLAMGFGAAWVGHPLGNLYRLRTDGTVMQRFVGGGINAVATSRDAVWVARSNGVVEQVSPANGSVLQHYDLGNVNPVALAVTDQRVWVALA